MIDPALVMIGGAVGSGLRYGVGLVLPHTLGTFPWSTLVVNVVGSFILGALVGSSMVSASISRPALLLLGTGLCGGFTTYSAFAVESALLAQEGQFSTLAIYTTTTLVCCGAASLAGLFAPRMLSH